MKLTIWTAGTDGWIEAIVERFFNHIIADTQLFWRISNKKASLTQPGSLTHFANQSEKDCKLP